MTSDPDDLRLDLDRARRLGLPEVIYGAGKTVDQCVRAVDAMLEAEVSPVIVTRLSGDQSGPLSARNPTSSAGSTMTWRHRALERPGRVAIVAGGTSDTPVVSEAQGVLVALGHSVSPYIDVGVSGLGRLLGVIDEIAKHDVVIAVAGMEAALPTVLGGLVAAPIIAVPTSVGYGSSLSGHTALLSMLASCAPGVTVVGIDNGFGAAAAAARILGDDR
ncbi:MAG: nickel pincer cofactor biosynthesis protein LarB [Acidobacteria bacterium]|nr:nickel pincer cofactor biosynthesis protein LarB [Acidobacteriota bacterium]